MLSDKNSRSYGSMKQAVMKSVNSSLRHFIRIDTFTPAQQEDGSWEAEWSLFAEVWAGKQNLYGSEYYTAGQVNKQETVKFTIRYMPGVLEMPKEKMRIVSDGKVYDIDFIDNIRYENEWLEIKAIEQAFGGGQIG